MSIAYIWQNAFDFNENITYFLITINFICGKFCRIKVLEKGIERFTVPMNGPAASAERLSEIRSFTYAVSKHG